jgi:hypothetical protein
MRSGAAVVDETFRAAVNKRAIKDIGWQTASRREKRKEK